MEGEEEEGEWRVMYIDCWAGVGEEGGRKFTLEEGGEVKVEGEE